MRLLSLLLLPIAAASIYYEIHGHLETIKAVDVIHKKSHKEHYVKVESHLKEIIGDRLKKFHFHEFQIHGEDVNQPTATFYGHLELSETIDIKDLQKSPRMDVFYLGKREKLPEIAVKASEDDTFPCVNGGFPLANSSCACPPFFQGATCNTPICMNGGIVDVDTPRKNRCSCPPGHYSMNCEPRGCLPAIQDKFDNSKQTFILVLNQKSTQSYVLNYIITGIQSTLDAITDQSQFLLDNYICVSYVFTTKGVFYLNKKSFDKQADFVEYLYGVTAIDGASKQFTNNAIYTAQSFMPLMHGFSNIFVFTDSTDISGVDPVTQVSSTADEMQAITQTLAWRNRPVYLISQMTGQPIANTGNDYETYRRVARATLGDIITFDMLSVTNILTQVLPAYLQNENLAVSYATTAPSITIPASDAGNVTVLITVENNGTLPSLKASTWFVVATGTRYLILTGTATTIDLTPTSPYSIRAWVTSGNTALLGYSTDSMIDIGSSYIPGDLSPVISTGLIGFLNNPTVTYSFIDNSGFVTNVLNYNSTASSRSAECSYQLQFQAFKSTTSYGPHMIQLTIGTTTRIVPGFAGQLDTHTAIPFVCYNGDLIGPSTCNCTSQFTGPNCATPVCFYGGKVNPFPGNGNPLCLCPAGFGGDHCDQLQCLLGPLYNFGTQRSFAVVMQSSMSQSHLNKNINQGLTNLFSGLQTSPFNEYLQTTFNNIMRNGQPYTQILSKSYQTSADFMYAMQSDNVGYMASSSPTQDSLNALYKAIDLLDYDKSSIFLFVDAPGMSNFTENDIIDAAVTRQLEINIIITPPYGMTELCMSPGDAGWYRDIAHKTGGMILNLCNTMTMNYTVDPVVQFLTSYGASHHHTENLNEALSVGGTQVQFYVDNPNDEVFAFVNCDNLESFSVTMTNTDNSDKTSLNSIATIPFVGVYRLFPAINNVNGYLLTVLANNGVCSIRVAERTQNALYIGFSSNPSIDRGFTSLEFGVPTSPVAHPYAGSYLINASSIHIEVTDDFGTIQYQQDSVRRQSCEYEFYFVQPFVCQHRYDTFVITAQVTTDAGTYQRTQRGYCYQPSRICLNGGTYDAPNYQCVCAANWEGDFCEMPTCQNGGSVMNFACSCATGFTGQFCQWGSCDQWNFMETNDVRQTDFKQLTFVLNRNAGQLLVNVQLDQILKSIVANTESPTTPTQYTLIHFDEFGVYDIVSTSHQQKFLDTFHNAINSVTRTSPTGTMSLTATSEAMKLNILPPNIIYVFTGTESTNTAGLIQFIRQRLGTQMNLFFTPSSTPYPQQPSGTYTKYLTQAVRQTGGRVLPLTPNSISGIGPVLVSTTLEDAFIMDDASQDCSNGVLFNFFVESKITRLVIEITGNDVANAGNVQVTFGQNVSLPVSVMFKDTAALILVINGSAIQNVNAAIWRLQIQTTSGSCYASVRAQSPIRVIPGFVSKETQDFVKMGPYTGFASDKTTITTFRVVDSGNLDISTSLQTLTVFHTQYYQDWKAVSTALMGNYPIKPRDPTNCASQFYAKYTVDNYGYYKYVVTGIDGNNYQFQRTFFFNQPSSRDDAATCQNGSRNPTTGECICNSNFSGDYCSDRICQNGGTPSYGICACPNGYFGNYCEQYLITPSSSEM